MTLDLKIELGQQLLELRVFSQHCLERLHISPARIRRCNDSSRRGGRNDATVSAASSFRRASHLEASAISDTYVLNALNRFKPQPSAEVVEAPQRLKVKEEPKADVARYNLLLKKLAMAAIAAMPMLMAAVSHRGVEVHRSWSGSRCLAMPR
jgi:hypothetical protein